MLTAETIDGVSCQAGVVLWLYLCYMYLLILFNGFALYDWAVSSLRKKFVDLGSSLSRLMSSQQEIRWVNLRGEAEEVRPPHWVSTRLHE